MENKSFIQVIRTNPKIKYSIFMIIFAFFFYGVLQMTFEDTFLDILLSLRFFTNLANILIFVIGTLYLLKYNNHRYYKFIAMIGLVAILMTGIIYHTLIKSGPMNFDNHVVHTINPILYAIFYFIFLEDKIKLRDFWVSLIFPLIYFIVILIQGSLTNWYPYNFLNPTYGDNTLMSVLIFCVGLLLPVISVFTVGLIYLKHLFEKYLV